MNTGRIKWIDISKEIGILLLIKTKTKQLIVPYIVFCIIGLIVSCCIIVRFAVANYPV